MAAITQDHPMMPPSSLKPLKSPLDSLVAQQSQAAMLLLKANLIGREQAGQALELAELQKKPLDDVLMASSLCSKLHLENARQARKFIEEHGTLEAVALEGLRIANRKGLAFNIGLMYLGWGF